MTPRHIGRAAAAGSRLARVASALDLRLAMNAAMVYASLTVVIVSIYVAALGISSLALGDAGFGASLMATGAVAVLAQPIRDLLQRLVDLLMYGGRDDPYAAITKLGERLDASLTPESALPAISETIARALRVPHARIELRRMDGFQVAGAFGRVTPGSIDLPLVHQGETIGRLVVAAREHGRQFSAADRRLLHDLARPAASAAHAVLLVADLQHARERLVSAREEERRLLRRRLHDEMGPALAGIGLRLDAARTTMGIAAPAAAARSLNDLRLDALGIVGDVRRIVDRLQPSNLDTPAAAGLNDLGGEAGAPGWRAAEPMPVEATSVAPSRELRANTRDRGSAPTRLARLAVAFGMGLLIFATAQALYRFGQPSDGWRFTGDATGWTRPWEFVFDAPVRDDPNALRPGDRLEAIDGRPIDDILTDVLNARSALPASWVDGGRVRETVVRSGRPVVVAVTLRSTPPSLVIETLLRATGSYPSFVLLVAISTFVIRRRPTEPLAILLWLFTIAIASGLIVETVSGPAPSTADLFNPFAFWTLLTINGLAWPILFAPVLAHLFLAFPHPARLLRVRPWPVLGILYGGGLVLLGLNYVVAHGDIRATWQSFAAMGSVWGVVVLASGVGRVGWLGWRERDPVARSQLQWVAWGFALTLALAVPVGVLGFAGGVDSDTALSISNVLVLPLPVSLAIAILRFRLFDIDLVWNRTLVYGALTAAVAIVYVVTVALLGEFVTQALAVSLLATGVVAVVVHPLRAWLQRNVNRLMFGERDEPYRVVSRLGQRLEATVSPERLLPVIAETVAGALRLPYVAIVLSLPDERKDIAASAGVPVADPLRLPLLFQGATIGELVLGPRRRGEAFGGADRALLAELARQTSRVANALRLRDALDVSRRQLLTARAEERVRIQRDLHDDLGPGLAAIAVKLEAAQEIVGSDPAAADRLLGQVQQEVHGSVSEIRRIVLDLRPQALDELGLVGAIRQQAARLEVAGGSTSAGPGASPILSVEATDRLPHLPAAVEVAAYRIVVEAITNAVRHSDAARCVVRLYLADTEELVVEVADDGRGLSESDEVGVGLPSMRERAAEVGGTCRVEARATGGTRVIAVLPLAIAEPIVAAA